MQELLLPRRILYFTEQELVFECRTQKTCECGYGRFLFQEDRNETFLYTSPLHADSPVSKSIIIWNEMITSYALRWLSHEKDRYNAFLGIANRFAEKLQDHYVAGLWQGQLHYCLLWYVEPQGPNLAGKNALWPSWTWVSVTEEKHVLIRHMRPDAL